MGSLKETLVALPPWKGDIYRRHQLVWRAMHGHPKGDRSFIFAEVSPSIVCVRSACLERGTPSGLVDGALRVDLVAARRSGQRMIALTDNETPEWASELLSQHGLQATRVTIIGSEMAAGRKLYKTSGETLAIQLPIKSLVLEVSIDQRAKANLAWAHGIGRGKRFGFGMLRRAG